MLFSCWLGFFLSLLLSPYFQLISELNEYPRLISCFVVCCPPTFVKLTMLWRPDFGHFSMPIVTPARPFLFFPFIPKECGSALFYGMAELRRVLALFVVCSVSSVYFRHLGHQWLHTHEFPWFSASFVTMLNLTYSENPLIQPLYNPESFVIRPDIRFRTTLHSIFTQ